MCGYVLNVLEMCTLFENKFATTESVDIYDIEVDNLSNEEEVVKMLKYFKLDFDLVVLRRILEAGPTNTRDVEKNAALSTIVEEQSLTLEMCCSKLDTYRAMLTAIEEH